jgi:hypothetical protein
MCGWAGDYVNNNNNNNLSNSVCVASDSSNKSTSTVVNTYQSWEGERRNNNVKATSFNMMFMCIWIGITVGVVVVYKGKEGIKEGGRRGTQGYQGQLYRITFFSSPLQLPSEIVLSRSISFSPFLALYLVFFDWSI